MTHIRSAAVLGAGVMGAQIAAHFANAGLRVVLLDVTRDAARDGLERARKLKPDPFFTPGVAALVTTGGFDEDLASIASADWIVEAIVERLDAKQALLARVEGHRRADAIVSSNTSGIPIASLAEGRSEGFRRHWLGTHFFNPPRYLHLLEVIPTRDTDPAVVSTIGEFADVRLGKGVVVAKDTPNFIANRIGLFGVVQIFRALDSGEYTIEEIDAITGPAIGRPKSATFRTVDIAGLDVLAHVARNLAERLPGEEREMFALPPFVEQMIARGLIGAKSGQGFYRKQGDDILVLDPKTLEYRPKRSARIASIEAGKTIESLPDRLRALYAAKDKAGAFLRATLGPTLDYAARIAPDIAHAPEDVDNAMRWGFAWELGPLETRALLGLGSGLESRAGGQVWDPAVGSGLESRAGGQVSDPAVGSGLKSRAGGQAPDPALGSGLESRAGGQAPDPALGSGLESRAGGQAPDPAVGSGLESRAGGQVSILRRGRLVRKNPGASLIDAGDGVLAVEFHSKMNAIGGDTIQMLQAGVKEAGTNFRALVVGNDALHFSAGANLMLIALEAQEGNWDEIDLMVRAFQGATMALKYADVPVVVAPAGLCLGGGCEIALHAARVQAAAETYMGLVEAGVGLIPAGGGTKEMLARAVDEVPPGADLLPTAQRVFETIGFAKVSTSGPDARRIGYLREGDAVTMNRDRLLADAKAYALELGSTGYRPPQPRTAIRVGGEGVQAALKLGVHLAWKAARISDYDAVIGRTLAWVLAGGNRAHPGTMTEQQLLDLEREAFLKLCGERKTLERIAHTLKTGKPLRN